MGRLVIRESIVFKNLPRIHDDPVELDGKRSAQGTRLQVKIRKEGVRPNIFRAEEVREEEPTQLPEQETEPAENSRASAGHKERLQIEPAGEAQQFLNGYLILY